MLGKLLKYEIKATGRIFLPLYLGLLVVSVFSGLTLYTDIEPLNIISWFLLSALYITLIVVTIILLIQRFYQNLLKNEGYLMFTLPVKPAMLITSKLIITCMWGLLSMIVGAIAALIASRGLLSIGEIMSEITSELNTIYPDFSIPALVIVLLVVSIIAQLIFGILQVYFSLAVGQLPPFGRHRILAAIITYLVTSTAVQMIAIAIATGLGPYFYRKFDSIGIIGSADGPIQVHLPEGTVQIANFADELITIVNQFLVGATAFNLIFAAAAFIGTSLILQKKLNLE